MATAKAPKAPPVLDTKATSAPVSATPAPVAKDFPPLTLPQAMTRKTGLPVEIPKTKPSPPVKDIPKSPVNDHASGHGKPQSKPGTPRSSMIRHLSGGDHSMIRHLNGGDHSMIHHLSGGDHSMIRHLNGGDHSMIHHLSGGDHSMIRHLSGGDHMHHGQGCACHKCSGGDQNVGHHHGQGCTCHRCIRGVNEVTHVSEPYCPNPSLPNITKDYETKVRIIQRIPEMRTVEKSFFVKQLVHEDRTTTVKKSRIIMVDVEEWVQVPVIKEVPKLKRITVHKIHEEIRNHPYEMPVIEYERHRVVKQIPRVRMVDVEEEIIVPVINEVPETVKVQIPTGEFCENPVEEYCTPGDFNLLCKDGRHHGDHHRHRSGSSGSTSSDSESGDEESHGPKHMKGDVSTAINTKHVQDHGSKESLSPIKTKPVQTHTKSSGDSKPKAPEPHHKLHEDPKSKPEPHDKQHPDPKSKAETHDKPHEGLKPKSKPQGEQYPAIKLKPHEEPKLKPHEEPKPKPHEEPKPKPHEEPKPKPHEEPKHKPHEKPKHKPHEEPKHKPHEEPKPKPHEEPKPKPHEEPKPKPHEEPKPKPHEEPKPKPHEEPKPKPHEEPKPKPHEEPKPKPHEENQYPVTKPKTHEEAHDTKPKVPTTESKPKVPTSNAPKRAISVDSKPTGKAHEDDPSKKVDSSS